MNYRDRHGKVLIGIVLLFIAGILFSGSVHGQENLTSATPLSTVSTYQLPKEPDATSNSLNSLQSPPTNETGENTSDNEIPIPLPGSNISLEKVCEPTDLKIGEETLCTVTIQNNSAEDIYYKLLDWTSPHLTIQENSVDGGNFHRHNIITKRGLLASGTPPSVAIENTDSPLVYDSLAALGIAPLTGVQDESIINVATLEPFVYGGETYTTIGIASNGYLIPGLGSDEDIAYIPQIFPDPAIPNNVIAPFWTDLNPEAGGNIYAALFIRDGESWVVIEWENIPAFDSEKPILNCVENCTEAYTFQTWIKTNTIEPDITFIYAKVDGTGSVSGLNVGMENKDGTLGTNYGSVPAVNDTLAIVTTPGTDGESHVISYTATANKIGHWHGCAMMKVYSTRGIAFDCIYGTISEISD
ncbi:MAG: hypothetical protein IAF02_19710 [Anaerolineae bacterium]|nr:hypothetical protein [Anaerolineae bacterium]